MIFKKNSDSKNYETKALFKNFKRKIIKNFVEKLFCCESGKIG